MRPWRFLLTLLLAIAGCKGSGIGPRVDNPVVGPPPPRRVGAKNVDPPQYATQDTSDDEANSAKNEAVAQTSFKNGDSAVPSSLDGNRVVASVNGAPIFEAEVLERYAESLAKYREQVSPEQYRQQCETLIERDLRPHVERKLLSEALRKTLKKEQQKQFDDFVKRQFKEQLDDMKADFKVTSTAELDRELQRRGTSIAMMEHQFKNKTLAQQYIASRVKSNKKLSRQDLFAYYQQHQKDYEVKPRVKWQQILIARGNEQQAQAKLKILVDGIKQGRDFGELASELSDGPTAANQGLYDWTNEGSLADHDVEAALFKLPIGDVSDLFKTAQNFQVVRVLERKKGGHTPFDEVQDQIREKLQQADHQEEISTLLDELWKSATIDTPYTIPGYQPPSS